jgi:hypothetical protein
MQLQKNILLQSMHLQYMIHLIYDTYMCMRMITLHTTSVSFFRGKVLNCQVPLNKNTEYFSYSYRETLIWRYECRQEQRKLHFEIKMFCRTYMLLEERFAMYNNNNKKSL